MCEASSPFTPTHDTQVCPVRTSAPDTLTHNTAEVGTSSATTLHARRQFPFTAGIGRRFPHPRQMPRSVTGHMPRDRPRPYPLLTLPAAAARPRRRPGRRTLQPSRGPLHTSADRPASRSTSVHAATFPQCAAENAVDSMMRFGPPVTVHEHWTHSADGRGPRMPGTSFALGFVVVVVGPVGEVELSCIDRFVCARGIQHPLWVVQFQRYHCSAPVARPPVVNVI